jgi:hypothetical protein
MVSSPIPGTAMAAAGAGTSALGISNDGNFYVSANAGNSAEGGDDGDEFVFLESFPGRCE